MDVCHNESRPQEADIHSRPENPPDYIGEVRNIQMRFTACVAHRGVFGQTTHYWPCDYSKVL